MWWDFVVMWNDSFIVPFLGLDILWPLAVINCSSSTNIEPLAPAQCGRDFPAPCYSWRSWYFLQVPSNVFDYISVCPSGCTTASCPSCSHRTTRCTICCDFSIRWLLAGWRIRLCCPREERSNTDSCCRQRSNYLNAESRLASYQILAYPNGVYPPQTRTYVATRVVVLCGVGLISVAPFILFVHSLGAQIQSQLCLRSA